MAQKRKGDTAWWDGTWSPQPTHKGVQRSSRYLEMRDGVKIAIDVYLPRSLQPGEKIPTILGQTRYYRRAIIRPILRPILNLISPFNKMVKRYLSQGYAFVMVDARGSGASFGSRAMEWSPDEVKDGAEIVDWIVAQNWSNGKVGATGVSYDGTAAEMLLINQHPAVKAVVLRYSLFDVYQDVAMPGGIRTENFLRTWSALNDSLDSNQAAGFFGQIGIARIHPDFYRPTRRHVAVKSCAYHKSIHQKGIFRVRDVTDMESAFSWVIIIIKGQIGKIPLHRYIINRTI